MTTNGVRLEPGVDRLDAEDAAVTRQNGAMRTLGVVAQGGNPLTDIGNANLRSSPEVEFQWRASLEGDAVRKMNETVFLNEQSGWGQVKKFVDDVAKRYKAQNESLLIKKPKDEQEAMLQMQQLKPVTVDPNEVANIRAMATKLDAQMKAVDPRTSFWTDPRTKKYADWINREAGGGGVGYLRSGEQTMHTGALGLVTQPAASALEGITNFPMNLVNGLWELGRQQIATMNGPDIGALMPTNYIEGDDGKLYSNGAKVPHSLDALAMFWGAVTGQNVKEFAARVGRAREMEEATRNGFETITNGAASIAGMAVGFGGPAGAAMRLGGDAMKGLTMLGTLRLAKGLEKSPRALKIIEHMANGLGASLANGAMESVAYGNVDGYAKTFMHGMMMAPVLMAVGQLGRRTEWFAKNRLEMPGYAAKAIGSAMEGVGFGAMEAHFPDLLPAAWGFIRDPNEKTWQTYAKNIAGFMLFSVAARGRPGALGSEVFHVEHQDRRARFAERVASGEATPGEVAMAPTPDAEKLTELGQASRGQREAPTPEGRAQQGELAKRLQSDFDVDEFGKSKSDREVEQALEGTPSRQQARFATQDEIRRLRELPPSHAKNKAIMELLRGSTAKVAAETIRQGEKHAKFVEEKRGTEREQQRQILGGDRELRAIMAPGETSVTTSELRSEMHRQLREQQGIELGHRDIAMGEKRGEKKIKVETHSKRERAMAEQLGIDVDELLGMAKRSEQPVDRMFVDMGGELDKLPAEEQGPPLEPKKVETLPLAEAKEEPVGHVLPKEVAEVEISGKSRATPSGERFGPQSLQLPPTTQIEPHPDVEPVRARDILAEMGGRPGRKGFRIPFTAKRIGGDEGDVVRVTTRFGKMRKRKALGVFKTFENLMRTKEGQDLVVAAHEWSHAMHRHTTAGGRSFGKEVAQQYKALPQNARDEIPIILKDYPGAASLPRNVQLMEAWAEWHARNLLGEVGLARKFPAFSDIMLRWLAAPAQARLRTQYQRLQDMLYRYNAQGSEERVRQSIVLASDKRSETEKAMREPFLARARDATTKMLFDDMVELKKAQDKVLEAAGRRPENARITEDPARLFDALRMTAGKTTEHFIMHGIRTPSGLVPGLREVLDPIAKDPAKRDDFYKFIVSVRNLELFQKGKTTQQPPQDYAETMKRTLARNPEFRDIATKLKDWTDALVDYVARSGNLDPADAQKIKDAYALYVPFFRAMEGPRQHGQGRGVAERGTGLSKIKGSTFEIHDPLVALQEVAQSMIAKAHQNQVMSALYRLAHGHEAGGLATVVPRSAVPKTHPVLEIIDALEKKIDQVTGEESGEFFDALRSIPGLSDSTITTFTQKVIPTGEKSIIAFTPRLSASEINDLVKSGAHRGVLEKQNNSLQWLEVDPKVYEALMGIDKMPHLPPGLQGVMRLLQVPRDIVRFFATGASPAFTAANMIRDALTAPMFSADGKFRPFGGFIDAIKGAIEYHKNGRMRELYEELGVKTSSFFNEGARREITGQTSGFRQKFLEMANHVQEFFSHPENYLRMSRFKEAYEGALKAGKPEQEARLLALESGKELMNFARAGIVSRFLNQTIPYFNAGMQGTRKLFGQLMWGGDVKGDEARARVQRATVLNGIVAITMPSIALWLMNKDEDWYQDLPDWRKINYWNVKVFGQIIPIPKPYGAGQLFGSIPEILLDRQLPDAHPASLKAAAVASLGSYMEGVGSFLPAFLRPLVEVGANYDFFRGRELTPEWVRRANIPSEQMTFYTTASARILSEAINGVLTPIEIEHLLGGFTAGASTSIMRAIDDMSGLKDHPLSLYLPWGRFFAQQEHGQSAYVDDLYQLSIDLDQREDTLGVMEKGLKRRVDIAKRQISDLRKQSRSGGMGRAEAERRAYELARPLVKESQR